MQIDVGDLRQIDRLFFDLEARHGRLDVLVNNVGIAGPRSNIEDVTDEEWERVMSINVTACFGTVRRCVPLMKRQGGGSIINISSSSTKTNPLMRSPYVVSKAAVEGLTRALARELGPFKIRCNAILPGSMNNDRMMRVLRRIAEAQQRPFEDVIEAARESNSMKTLIEMRDVADMAAFLASDEAQHVSGQLIAVDGNVEREE
jgi:NAD(P)-dependent dehydrogenase (short-subunit alcohol dehydrogenase family)